MIGKSSFFTKKHSDFALESGHIIKMLEDEQMFLPDQHI